MTCAPGPAATPVTCTCPAEEPAVRRWPPLIGKIISWCAGVAAISARIAASEFVFRKCTSSSAAVGLTAGVSVTSTKSKPLSAPRLRARSASAAWLMIVGISAAAPFEAHTTRILLAGHEIGQLHSDRRVVRHHGERLDREPLAQPAR